MTLLASFLGLCGVLFSGFLFAGLGRFLLDRVRLSIENHVGRCLASIAVGVVSLEFLVSVGELAPNARTGVLSALALPPLWVYFRFPQSRGTLAKSFEKSRGLTGLERWLALGLGGVLFLEGFAAMAPLSGSDAPCIITFRCLCSSFAKDFIPTGSCRTAFSPA